MTQYRYRTTLLVTQPQQSHWQQPVRTNKASPGVKRGTVEQGAVETVADKVGAHHRAFAVFGGGDGFGDNQVSFVPHVQQVDVEHQRGIRRNHLACKHG